MGTIEEQDPQAVHDFSSLPPFPANVPTVPLSRISLEKLISNENGPEAREAEEEKLWKACTTLGFFYLELCPPSTSPPSNSLSSIMGETLDDRASQLFSLGEKVFDLPLEEKMKYDLSAQNSYFGYKGFGAGVIDSKGTKDRNEFYNVSKDDILYRTTLTAEPPLPAPPLLQETSTRRLLEEFIRDSHLVVRHILSILNDKLGLPEMKLEVLHRIDGTSGDQVRWVKSPPQPRDDRAVALGEHTDFGSVTILFNRLGGLQVLPPVAEGETPEWKYVRPLEGCCVVNLGDAMVKFSRGILRSNIHRVVNPPGEQEGETRYSLVYFARPEDHVQMKGLTGSEMIDSMKKEGEEEEESITAKEWIIRRALSRRTGGDYEKSLGTEGGRLAGDGK